MKKITYLFLLSLCFSVVSFGQLIVKDQETTPNTLLQVNDEGSAGSITLPDVATGLTGAKLYNNGGNLFWGTNQLGFTGSAGGWTKLGVYIYPSLLTDRVGIGTSTPQKNLHVKGSSEIFRLEASSPDGWISIYNTVGSVPAYKGYLGIYNGDNDIDLGTGGGNTTGNLNLVTNANPRVVISATGDVDVSDGTLNISTGNVDIQSGELNRSGITGTANLVPLAFGNILYTGVIISGTGSGNFNSAWNPITWEYEITINGESSYNNLTVLLTPRRSGPVYLMAVHARIADDKIYIGTLNVISGAVSEQCGFSFVVFKP